MSEPIKAGVILSRRHTDTQVYSMGRRGDGVCLHEMSGKKTPTEIVSAISEMWKLRVICWHHGVIREIQNGHQDGHQNIKKYLISYVLMRI